jgi:hypothetical protein
MNGLNHLPVALQFVVVIAALIAVINLTSPTYRLCKMLVTWVRGLHAPIGADPAGDDAVAAASLIPPVFTHRRLTPARHAGILEHLQQVKRDLDMVSDATRAPDAVGDAAMLYQVVQWLAPITEELLCEHVQIAPAMTLEEQAPTKRLNERYRKMAAGAFGITKPDGERPL